MPKNKQPPLQPEDIWDEEEYTPYLNDASEKSDKNSSAMFLLAGAIGGALVISKLGAGEKEALISTGATWIETTPGAVRETPQVMELIVKVADLKTDILTVPSDYINKAELGRLNQILQDTLQYNRLTDPRTAENIAFRNAEIINEQLGNFGFNESGKQAMLQTYIDSGYEIWADWINAGANTCDECLEIGANSPYRVDDWPEPSHFGCECIPGPIIVMRDGEVIDTLTE